MTAPLQWGAFAPQGWKLEYSGWSATDAWDRTKELAHLTEQLGYHHLWVYDHVETVPRREPTHVFEAFTTLAALAQHTTTIKLGQMVTCAAYRNAGLLAKEAACVDVFSGGRLILGIGAGWYEREYQAYGFPFPSAGTRLQLLEETVEVLKRLWTEETVTYQGKHLAFDGAYCDPKPLQQLPELWIGGGGASRPGTPTRRTGRPASTGSCASRTCCADIATRSDATSTRSCARTVPIAVSSTPKATCNDGSTHLRAVRCGVEAIPTNTSATTSSAPRNRSRRRRRRSSTRAVESSCCGSATSRRRRAWRQSRTKSCRTYGSERAPAVGFASVTALSDAPLRKTGSTEPSLDRRPVPLLLVAAFVVIGCAGLVFFSYTRSALWLDEALTVNIARLPLSQLQDALKHDGAPPLYYVLLHFWRHAQEQTAGG